MSVAIHVIHVPGANAERDAVVARLVKEGGACVHADPERRGLMPNWLGAIAHAAQDTSRWSAVLSDDAVPLKDWERHLVQATFFSPAPVLGLTHFGAAMEPAYKKRVPYVVGPHMLWGGAIAYEHSFVERLAPWARWVYDLTHYPHDDRLVSAFAQKEGTFTAGVTRAIFDQLTSESLVGHAVDASRRPNLTIQNIGPMYGVVPRYTKKSTGGGADQRDWLAKLGTEVEDPEWTFKVVRKGAVQRVRRAEVSA